MSDFDKRDFINYAIELIAHNNWSDNTIRARMVNLSALNRWLFYQSQCLRYHNPPKIKKRPKWRDIPDKQEFDLLFSELKKRYETATAGRRWSRYRDYLVSRILYETGMRVGECANLRYGDLIIHDKDNFWLFIAEGKSEDAERACPISEKLCDEIRAFVWTFSRMNKSSMLFHRKVNTPMDTNEFCKFIKKFAFDLKIDAKLTPHVFRHNFILDFVADGGSALDLMSRLGHSDVQMTVYYFNQVRRLLPFAKVNGDISILEKKNRSRARFWDEKNEKKGW